MLIIEGADLVGKTTLVKKLKNRLKDEGIQCDHGHYSRKPGDWDWYCGCLQDIRQFKIQDRFHIGEYVYPMVRNEKPLDPQVHRMIDGCLRVFGGFVVVVSATKDTIVERHKRRTPERKEMYPLDQILEANQLYIHLPSYMDVDYRVHVAKWGYDERTVIEDIMTGYLTRQSLVAEYLKDVSKTRSEGPTNEPAGRRVQATLKLHEDSSGVCDLPG